MLVSEYKVALVDLEEMLYAGPDVTAAVTPSVLNAESALIAPTKAEATEDGVSVADAV